MHVLRIGRRLVDLDAGTVDGAGELSPIELRLLRYLGARLGQAVARDELLAEVWGYSTQVLTRTIDNTVRRLRVKIEDDPSDPRFLRSLYGRGLILEGAELTTPDDGRSPLVGRADAVQLVLAALGTSRLVTVVGPGGIGKTRVAEAVTALLASPTVRASCAGLTSAEEIDHRVSSAVGVSASPVDTLRARALVLYLDECETHTRLVAARVRRWLAEIAGLRVLVTSRIVLDVPGEHVVALDPLTDEASLALFRDCSSRWHPPAPSDDAGARRVVAQLDGLPLAIELAAARTRLIGTDRLVELVREGFTSLEDRRTSLADVLERSWSLCSDDDRRILAAASLFTGTFDLDDLSAVAGLSVADGVRALGSLVSQSLLVVVRGPPVRHRLLAPVRERAARDLAPDAEAHLRYARWFARLGDPERIDPRSSEHHARVAAATSDLARALSILRPVDPEAAACCVNALVGAYVRGGGRGEGLLLHRDLPPPRSDRLAASIANQAAMLLTAASQLPEAAAVLQEVLPRCTDPTDLSMTLASLAGAKWNLGEVDEARALVARCEGIGATWAQARSMLVRGKFTSDRAERAKFLAASAALAEASGERRIALQALSDLTEATHLHAGNWAAARRAYRKALDGLGPPAEWRATRQAVRHVLTLAGRLELLVGNLDEAESYLEQAMELPAADLAVVPRLLLARVWSLRGDQGEALAAVEALTTGVVPLATEPAALALIVNAECVIRDGVDRDEAARAERWCFAAHLLARAEPLVRTGRWPHLVAELYDLLGAITADPDWLARAAQHDDTAYGVARRLALSSWIAARTGQRATAARDLDAAEARIRALELQPGSDVVQWAQRASRSLGRG